MNYEDWVKLWSNPLKMNWSEPLTEEEKIKLGKNLPKIAKILLQEHKQLRQLKKLADKFEREASAKDSETSKERMRMRLRKKLADKKEAMAKDGLTHLCTDECERRQKKRAKKLAAKKMKAVVEESRNPEFSEEQHQNLEGENNDLHQYRDPEKNNDDNEKEDDCLNGEDEEDNDGEGDGEGLNVDYSSSYEDINIAEKFEELFLKLQQQAIVLIQQKMDHYGSNLVNNIFDTDRRHNGKDKEVKGDDDNEDEIDGLQMKLLAMSKEPQQSHGVKLQQPQDGPASIWSRTTELEFSGNFSKFLDYKYHF